MKISVQELLIVLVIVLIIFGPTQLPKLMKSLGESLRGFKKGMEEPTVQNEPVKESDENENKEA